MHPAVSKFLAHGAANYPFQISCRPRGNHHQAVWLTQDFHPDLASRSSRWSHPTLPHGQRESHIQTGIIESLLGLGMNRGMHVHYSQVSRVAE